MCLGYLERAERNLKESFKWLVSLLRFKQCPLDGNRDQFPFWLTGLLPFSPHLQVALGTVTNVEEAVKWLSYTYFYVRMRANPLAYGINHRAYQVIVTWSPLFFKNESWHFSLIIHQLLIHYFRWTPPWSCTGGSWWWRLAGSWTRPGWFALRSALDTLPPPIWAELPVIFTSSTTP